MKKTVSTDAVPGASALRERGFRCRGGAVMRRKKGGRGKPLPYGVNAKPWGRCVSAGRRGRRPLRGECEAVGRVRIGGTSRTPSPTGWCEISGVVRKAREGQAPPLRGGAKPTRDVEDAVPYGVVRNQHGTSGTPSPTGWCEISGMVRKAREGASPSRMKYDDCLPAGAFPVPVLSSPSGRPSCS